MILEIGKKYNVLGPDMIEIEYDMEYLCDTFVFETRIHLFRDVEEPNFIIAHSDNILQNYLELIKTN